MSEKREAKRIKLLADGAVKQENSSNFLVRSGSHSDKWYKVRWEQDRWKCNCADYLKRSRKCKHVYAVGYYLSVRDLTSGIRDSEDDCRCLRALAC